MKTNYVLIDYENVQPATLAILDQEHFRIIVFVGANQAKITFEVASALQPMGTRAEYVRISGNGANALDFHIAGSGSTPGAVLYCRRVARRTV